jgi:hypothetical protein
MKIIRIPIGSTLDDKTKFINEFLRVFPSNSKEEVENIWKRQVAAGVLQMMVDIETGIVSHVMRVSENGTTYWELSSRFLSKIPIIYDYKPEENQLPENTLQASTFAVNTKVDYDIDDLLDIISEKGYETLSVEQKSFLAKYSKK